MAQMGKFDASGLEKFMDKAQQSLSEEQLNLFIESCAKELAARLLAKVIKRTPVGQYPHRVGGTLRRGWTGEKSQGAASYVDSLKVTEGGGKFSIEIINPVEYASYVEFGHRTRNHKGWVEGKFMLTISVQEVQQAAPGILERKLQKKLKEAFQ